MTLKGLIGHLTGSNTRIVIDRTTEYVYIGSDKTYAGMTAVVTGGTGSIGEAICRRLALEGMTVYVCGRNAEKLKSVSQSICSEGNKAFGMEMDVSDEASVEKAFSEIAATQGHIDVLVNCAGYSARTEKQSLYMQSVAAIETLLRVNLLGVLLCSRVAAQYMIRQKSGKIVNIASIVGMGGKVKNVEYSAAKGGVITLTKSLAMELGRYGITVNCVSPGLIPRADADEEKLGGALKTNCLGIVGKPQDIAGVVNFLVSPEASFITGVNIPVDGGRSLGLMGDTY